MTQAEATRAACRGAAAANIDNDSESLWLRQDADGAELTADDQWRMQDAFGALVAELCRRGAEQ